jgi:SAM-dependent methyltransferase
MEIDECRICNNKLAQKFVFREMMFGLRNEFHYGQCSNCCCIQILEVPVDIEKYYPPYYVSFTQKVPALKRLPFLKRQLGNLRMQRKYRTSRNHLIEYLRPIRLSPNARILDIGCGKGALICSLYNLGFTHISGVDKFIPAEIDYGNGVKVYKKELSELAANSYNLLMMHHVLEHIDEQVSELKECNRLLKKGGVLLINIPVLGKAWEIYKQNWVQLDAPRHFVLHTLKSMAILAEKTGFTIGKTIFDSTAFQFWGSELYKKDIPLTLPGTHEWYLVDKGFTPAQILQFDDEAKLLNAAQTGDSAIFYLYKK